MRKLDAASYRAMPWKNGGGTTTEIARSPEGESLDDFDWRISMARVATAGPFSRFVGVDRSIAILEGDGITLVIEGSGATRLDRSSPPFAFPADVAVTASLAGGAVEDFNVMTRRGAYRHRLTRVRYDARTILPESLARACSRANLHGSLSVLGDLTILFVVEGSALAELAGAAARLGPRDALLFERGTPLALSPGVDRAELCSDSPSDPKVELLAVDLWRDRGDRD